MKAITFTVLLCLSVTPALAEGPGDDDSSTPTAPSYAPTAHSAYTYHAPAATDARNNERSSGFHFAVGAGFAGGNGRPGIGTQVRIGGRLSADWVLFYYALNDWYKTTGYGAYWRIAGVNGMGIDYFVLRQLGIRLGVGVGVNGPADLSNSQSKKRHLGYSYVMGLTLELGDGASHFSIDPVIHVQQTSGTYYGGSTWDSIAYFLLTANWVWN